MLSEYGSRNDSYQKWSLLLGICIVVSFTAIRALNLDADIPLGWAVVQYQHFDEIFYSLPALNLFHYGQWDIEVAGFKYIDTETYISLPLWNLLNLLFLSVIKDALVAIRLPALIAGVGVYIIYLAMLTHIRDALSPKFELSPLLHILFCILPVFDFTLYLASRINEPTIFRLFFAMLLFYVFLKFDRIDKKLAFWIGCLAAGSVFFIYLYNLFLVLFAGLALMLRKEYRVIPNYMLGIICVFLAWVTLFEILNNVSIIETIRSVIFESKTRTVGAMSLQDVLLRVSLLLTTNFLSFSPALIVVLVFGALWLLGYVRVNSSNSSLSTILVVSYIYLFSLALQSVFISDFVQRKGLMLYAPTLIICYSFSVVISSTNSREYVCSRAWATSIIFVAGGLALFFLKLSGLLVNLGYADVESIVTVNRDNYLTAGLVFIACVLMVIFNKRMVVRKRIIASMLLATLVFNSYLIYDHGMARASNTFQNVIRNIGGLAPGEFVGNFSYGFTLGNRDHKPYFFLYTPKIMGVNTIEEQFEYNRQVVDRHVSQSMVPVYTILQGKDSLDRWKVMFPDLVLVYSSDEYRDVEAYSDYRTVISEEKSMSTQIHVVRFVQTNTPGLGGN